MREKERLEREIEADRKIERAAANVGEILGIEGFSERLEGEYYRDWRVAALWRKEAIAELLEEIEASLASGETEQVITQIEGPQKPEDLDGIGPELASELARNGYTSLDDLDQASDDELLAINGIAEKKLAEIREGLAASTRASELSEDGEADTESTEDEPEATPEGEPEGEPATAESTEDGDTTPETPDESTAEAPEATGEGTPEGGEDSEAAEGDPNELNA